MTTGLIYHDVAPPDARDDAGFPGPVAAAYKHTPAQFEAHLDALQVAGLDVGLIAPGVAGPQLALTFDDGGASALDVAQRLERRGWRGHFFIVTERVGTPGFLTAGQVHELADRGHLVGSHTSTHPMSMRSLSSAQLRREWGDSRERLAELLGTAPEVAAVPGGSLSREVIDTAASAGYRLLLTSQPSPRTRRHGSMELRGRFTIWARTPPEVAVAYARGDARERGRAWAFWTAKTLAKRVSPVRYEQLRRARIR